MRAELQFDKREPGFFERFFYQFYPLQLNAVRLYNLDEAFYRTLESNPFMRYTYQDHFDAGLGGMLYYTSGKDLTDLEPARYARFSGDLSGNLISLFHNALPKNEAGQALLFGAPYARYVKGEFTYGRAWRFGPDDKQAVATRVTGGIGYAYGNTTALPFEKQFYCGGANSMRGWQTRTLGPGSSGINTAFSIPSQTGDVKLEASTGSPWPGSWKEPCSTTSATCGRSTTRRCRKATSARISTKAWRWTGAWAFVSS